MTTDPYLEGHPSRTECERDEEIVGRMRDVRSRERLARIEELRRMDPFNPENQQ